jgi:hypothetical protein
MSVFNLAQKRSFPPLWAGWGEVHLRVGWLRLDEVRADTGRIYIKGYLYPILYPKISKKDISYPFLEQDILRI